jgi:hypothetical protein
MNMQKKNWKMTLGVILMIVATLIFMSLLIVPLLKISGKEKITITTIIIVAGEITFWSGGLLVGKEILTKYRAYLNPKRWFKKKIEEV